LDFGITVYLGKATREHLAGLLAALVKEDFERVVAHFIELADPPAAFDVESFQYEVRNTVAPFIGLSLKQIRSGKLFWDLAKVAANHGAPMPQELIIFLKTLVTFEGIGSHLSPSFDLMHTCEKFATRIREELYSPESFKQTGLVLARDIGTLVRQAPYQLRRLLRAALDGELAIRVNSEEAHLLRAAVDLAGARIGAGLASIALIAGGGVLSLTVSSNMPRILGMPAIGFAGCVTGSLLVFWLVWSTILGRTRR
jgi:ubiquinone biosynthesis protein